MTELTKLSTADERKEQATNARLAGAAAFHAGMPCEAPMPPIYDRESLRACWRLGWKYARRSADEHKGAAQSVGTYMNSAAGENPISNASKDNLTNSKHKAPLLSRVHVDQRERLCFSGGIYEVSLE